MQFSTGGRRAFCLPLSDQGAGRMGKRVREGCVASDYHCHLGPSLRSLCQGVWRGGQGRALPSVASPSPSPESRAQRDRAPRNVAPWTVAPSPALLQPLHGGLGPCCGRGGAGGQPWRPGSDVGCERDCVMSGTVCRHVGTKLVRSVVHRCVCVSGRTCPWQLCVRNRREAGTDDGGRACVFECV